MAIPFNASKHDIGFLRQDGTTSVGLMLARDPKTGKPIYQVDDDEYLAQQQTQEPGYDGLPYEKEIRFGQDDWGGGFGQETYEATLSTKYLEAHSVLNYNKGRSLLGGGISTISMSGGDYPSFAGNTMESWDDATTLTHWTKALAAGATLDQEAATIYAGTYSAKITGNAAGVSSIYGTLSQYGGTINNLKGKYFRTAAYVNTSTATHARIAIETDGTGGTTTYSSYHTGAAGWERLAVGVAIPSDCTYIRVHCYVAAAAQAAYFDAFTSIALALNSPYCMEPYNSCIYFATSCSLFKINSSGTTSLVAIMDTDITCLKAFTDGNLYIGQGLSVAYKYINTSDTVTVSNAAVSTFQYFEQLDATSPTLYGNDGTRTIRSTIAPTNGGTAWSAQTTIDTTEWAITGLLCEKNILFIIKGNRPYYLDTSGNVVTLTSMTDAIASTTGGRGSIGWQGRVYMPYGVGALLEYDISEATFTWRQPALFGFGGVGTIAALAGDEQFLYILSNYGATTVLGWAGRYETTSNGTQWVWHQVYKNTSLNYVYGSSIISSAINSRKNWLLSLLADVKMLVIPSDYGDVATDSKMRFDISNATCYFTTPWLHGGFKSDKKAFLSLTLTMGHTYNAGRYITAQYQLVGDSSWTSLGNFTGTSGNMTETKYFSPSTRPKSTMIRFKFLLESDSNTVTPILESYYCVATLFPTRRNIIRCVVKMSDDVSDKLGQRCVGLKDMEDTVVEAKDTATSPVTFYDIAGSTKYVKLLASRPFLDVISLEAGKPIEKLCYLNLLEVKYS